MVREDLKNRFPALFWKISTVDKVSRKRASVPLRCRPIACKSSPVQLPDDGWDSDLEEFLSETIEPVVIKLDFDGGVATLNALILKAGDGDQVAVAALNKLMKDNTTKVSPDVKAVVNELSMNLGQPISKEISGLDDLEL